MHEGLFNNIPHFIKNSLRINCMQGVFVVYNDKVSICKQELVPQITYYAIPDYFCQKNQYVI